MASVSRESNISQSEIDQRQELLKESLNECILMRDFYICKIKESEMEVKRLVQIKENLTYLKNILLQDLYKSNVNPGKERILLNKTIEEFQEKHYSMKLHLENLPSVSQLKELIQSNQQLLEDHLSWTKKLVNLKKEYSQVYHNLENDLKKKITGFSWEMSKKSNSRDDKSYNSS